MFKRLGFIGRLLLIVLALLFAFTVLGFTLKSLSGETNEQGTERFPIPAKAAAVAELLDRTPPENREYAAKAVSDDKIIVTLTREKPKAGPLEARMPAVEWLVKQYLETMPSRSVRAYYGIERRRNLYESWMSRLKMIPNADISIQVALKDGSYVEFILRGDGTKRLLGVPEGYWFGIFGGLFAALAVWAIVREARPLGALAKSVEQFADDGQPREVKPQGAPELRELIMANNTMQARIATLLKARAMLLGAISHDLKTYVTRLRLRAEFISPQAQQDRAVKDLDDMTALIDSALSVARGALTPDRRDRVDLGALAAEEIARRADETIDFALPSAETAHDPAIVVGDAVALRSVVANLLDNAHRYAGRCRVSVSALNGGAKLIIEDNGPGIPEGERAAVFEPFYRLDKSRSTATGGSGLGLAITKQIIDAHGGTIVLDTSGLGGARFQVFFPIAQNE